MKKINFKLDDKYFLILIIAMSFIVVASIVFLISKVQNLERLQFEVSNDRKVILIDNLGNETLEKFSENEFKLIKKISLLYVQNVINFNYLDYKDKLRFIRIYSSPQVSEKYKQTISPLVEEVTILHSMYKGIIEKYKFNTDKDAYTLKAQVYMKNVLPEKEIPMKDKFIITLKFVRSTPTEENKIGVFAEEIDIKVKGKGDEDEGF